MADFRKWLLAFAVVALLSSLAVPASAQVTPLTCAAVPGVPPVVRAEGVAELMGDLLINCTGGQPTAANGTVPKVNIQIFLSTNITSRLLDTANPSASEALLVVDDPNTTANPSPFKYCAAGAAATGCNVTGVGIVAASTPGHYTGPYNGGAAGYNVFQAQSLSTASPFYKTSLVWNGIPFDPPGTNGVRSLRITNVRGDATQVAPSQTFLPTTITEYISITGSQSLPVTQTGVVVAYVLPGLLPSASAAPASVQCISINPSNYPNGSASFANPSNKFTVTLTEGFASSFKVRNTAVQAAVSSTAADVSQNVPGGIYYTESGLVNIAAGGVGDLFTAGVGQATQGTQFSVSLASIPKGVALYTPLTVTGTGASSNLVLQLVGGTSTATAPGGYGQVSISADQSAKLVYEVVSDNPNAIETIGIPFTISYQALSASDLPQAGVIATATADFYPISTINTMTTAATPGPIPRFVPKGTPPTNVFSINRCSCNILFPFVTNQAGYDTGLAISNTTQDPYGTQGQTGKVTLYFYGDTVTAPKVTSTVVKPGQTLTYLVSAGGNFGLDTSNNPGFQGYVIAQSEFQYCHGFAFITGGQGPTSVGASEGYLGIVLDNPWNPNTELNAIWNNRTGNFGESQGL